MKQLKNYLHLYKDCIVRVKRKNDKGYHRGRVCEITSKSNHGDWVMVWFENVIEVTSSTWDVSSSNAHTFFFGEDEIFAELRPLTDITKEELLAVMRLCYISVYDDEPEFENIQFLESEVDKGLKADTGSDWHYGLTIQEKYGALFSANGSYLTIPHYEITHYLLGKHFDLFGLIAEKIAYEAS